MRPDQQHHRENQESGIEIYPTFNDFWDKYAKKINADKCQKKWNKLSRKVKLQIMQHLEVYIKATPDKQYRKITQRTETSKYLEEKKTTVIPQVVASERGTAQTKNVKAFLGL